MHIVPFDSDTEKITISIPPWPLWVKVEKMQFDYDGWIIPPIEMTEEKIKNFPICRAQSALPTNQKT